MCYALLSDTEQAHESSRQETEVVKNRTALTAALGVALGLTVLFTFAQGVEAKNESEFLPAFEAAYPGAVGSRIDTCTLCHNIQGTEYKRNAYARQWEEADESFAAISNLDADGDGYTNVDEIAAHTFPGNASDNPSTVTTTTTLPGATTTTAAPGSGAAIYQARCASCHGGSGGNLVPTTLSLSQIVGVVANGSGSMPGYSGSLTNAEIQSVSEYLFNWAPVPTTTTTTVPGTPPPSPPDGRALYGASCAQCHGANGGDLVGTALSRSRLVDIITAGTTAGMPSYRSTHSDAEIGAMADYILSITPSPATTTTTVPGTPPPPPPTGSAVYAAQCAACHGSSGGDLVGRGISTSRILTVTNSGTTGMPGFSSKLTATEVDAVVAYVAAKASAPAAPTTTEPGAAAPSGSAVYETRCAACHGSAGGDLLGRGLSGSRISTVTKNGTSGMPGFATRLSETEIDGVVAYLVTIDADPEAAAAAAATVAGGGEEAALYVEFCSACHGAHGQGGRYGPVAGTSLSLVDLITVIRDGSDWMPGFSEQMTSGEIGAVARFVESLGPGDSSDTTTVLAPGASAETAFEQLCSTCHTTSGEGLGADAAFGGELDADAVTNLIRNGHFGVPGNAELSDAALEALVEYTLLLDDESTAIAAVADIGSGAQAMAPSPVDRVSEDAEDGGGLGGLTLLVLGVFIPAGVLAYWWLRKPRTV